MTESLFKNLMSMGEEAITTLSNQLFSNPTFLELLKKGVAVKETMDSQAALALKRMNLVTKKDLSKIERRLSQVEAELAELKQKIHTPRKKAKSSDDAPEAE